MKQCWLGTTVIKRCGKVVEVDFNKITERLKKLCNEKELKNVNIIMIAQKTIESIYPNITTQELDIRSADICAEYISINPWYGILGGRILASNLQKNLKSIYKLSHYSDRVAFISKIMPSYLNKSYVDFVQKHKNKLNKLLISDRDFEIDYFGFRTLERSYLFKHNNQIMETPQDMWMRVAVNIHYRTKDITLDNILEKIKTTYDLLSTRMFIHATPTLFNAGTNYEQCSSCYLLGTDDSLTNIFKTIGDCAMISKWAGGIGVHVSNIRSAGTKIKSTNGTSTGIIPMLKVYNDVGRYVNQCFVPETPIMTKLGSKMIKDINFFDEVLTSDGTFKPVLNVICNQKNEEILEIETEYGINNLKCTKVHEILSTNNINEQPKYIAASELKPNDYLVYRIPEDYEIGNNIQMLHLSEDDCQFYGYLVNSIINKETKECKIYNCSWTKDYLDTKNINYQENYGKLIFNLNDIRIFNYNDLYDNENNNIISYKIMTLSNRKILKMIKGLLFRTNNENELTFSTSSTKMINDLIYLFLRLGIPIKGDNNKIIIPRDPILCEELKLDVGLIDYIRKDNMIFNKIKSINTIHYTGNVYDLNIKDNHNYTTNVGLVHNSGKRNGSIAIYLEPWHADIFDFLELKLNTGPDELRTRDLFLALWIPDLFMKQVEKEGEWYLMSPDTSPGLQDVYGEEFEKLYNKYVEEGKYIKKVDATKLWEKIMISQIETGVPYICFKDNVNRKSNHMNIGTVKSSNLCAEIMEVSNTELYAVCNLASIAVNMYLKEDKNYDFDKLHEVAKIATYNLNNIIDINYYPTPETKRSNMETRPIGIGIQGLADLFYLLKMPYESEEAINLSAEIMETIYHGAIEMSIELAEKSGSYDKFEGSPFSEGKFQFDMWEIKPKRYDWSILSEKIKKVGIRNSLLTALMPTATTSQILGNVECFEVATSNIYTRKTLAGNFMLINKYLIQDLKDLGIWDLDMKNRIIEERGSIQNIETIPDNIKQVYKTAWEIKQRYVIDHAVARAPYVDQSQSMNLFMAIPTYEKITSALFYGWRKGLKTGCYYLRSQPAIAPQQFSIEAKKKTEEVTFCSLANPEACMMCSS